MSPLTAIVIISLIVCSVFIVIDFRITKVLEDIVNLLKEIVKDKRPRG